MQLSAIRAEILNHGFDPGLFPTTRLNSFINDGYLEICRRMQYYTEETTQTIATVNGTATISLPASFIRVRSLVDTDRHLELQPVSVRQIDQSPTSQGVPNYYAFDATNLRLYPTPNGVYNLLLRYWALPAQLVNDTDVPALPSDTHNILWVYGCWICYEAENDIQEAQYWQQRFDRDFAELEAAVKFPGEIPVRAAGMWGDDDAPLASNAWRGYIW